MTVIVETERLFLRELLLNDVEPLSAITAKPAVTQYTGGGRDPAAVRDWIQAQHESYRARGYGDWAIIHRESATLVGHAGLTREPGGEPELCCEIDEPYWRMGLGRETLSAVIDHAFARLNLDRITARIHPKNEAGKKLAEAIGMTLESERESLIYSKSRNDA